MRDDCWSIEICSISLIPLGSYPCAPQAMWQIGLRSGWADGADHVGHVKHAYRKETYFVSSTRMVDEGSGLDSECACCETCAAMGLLP